MTLQFCVLGPLEVRSGSGGVEISGARRRALLAYLLVHAGVPQPLDRIVEELDPESEASVSPATVQTYVSQLRKLFADALGEGTGIVHRAGGYLFEFPPNALDATRFETAVATVSGDPDPDARLSVLTEALELWRGPPLDEFRGREWADDRARHWTRLYVLAQHLTQGALLDTGNHRDARVALEQLVAGYPLHEPFWEQLIVARYRCGEQAEALAAAREARAILALELGVEPGPSLLDLERRVLAQDPALAVPGTTSPVVRSTQLPIPLPSGVVTFLLTDIEGSTQLWDEHSDEMAKALDRYEDLVEEVIEHHGGRLLKWRGEGDSTMSVFATATDACAATVALQRCLGSEVWPGALTLRTRAALHTGEAQLRDGDYYGGTVNRAARIRSLATGGETLISRATHDVVADVLSSDVRLVDVGEYEIAGMRRNENLFLLAAPGLESPGIARQPADRPGDDFVGRVHDVERVAAALATPGLVTITGPGGIGKTRLMREVQVAARRGSQTFDRFYNVELAGARDRAAVEGALHTALVADDAVVAVTGWRSRDGAERAIDELVNALGSRRILLALDNCEHLIDDVAGLVDDITARCPNVSVLATSREPLELAGERVVALNPLALPDSADTPRDRLAEVDAMRLLLHRARDGGSDLTLTAETAESLVTLCRLLDGVPLAIELAAARLRSTSPADLCARLVGQMHVLDTKRGDPRHRSLYGAIDWSYQLLDPGQQLLLGRLAIFVGGFTLAAAEEVCADDADGVLAGSGAVYVNLAELVSKSLVMFDRDQNRYRLLEPVRMFARERLDAQSGAAAVADRHAQWVLHASEAALAGQVFGTYGTGSTIVADLDNVHAALDWLDASDDHTTFLRIVASLGFTWSSSDWRRGRIAAARAIELSAGARPRLRGSVLLSRGIVEQRADQYESRRFFVDARKIFLDLDDQLRLAWATFYLGRAHILRDNVTCARHMVEAVDLFRAVQLPLGEAWAELNLGSLAEMDDDVARAGEHYDRAYELATQIGHIALQGTAVGELAGISLAQEDFTRARAQLREAIELQRVGGHYNVAPHLNDLALVEVLAGDPVSAREYVVESIRLGVVVDDDFLLSEALMLLAVVLFEEGDPREARRIMAASGWDVAPPEGLIDYEESILARALTLLEPVRVAAYDDAEAEGRRAGTLETARAFLAVQEQSK